MQTIFLDIDGVLNDLNAYYGWDLEYFQSRSDLDNFYDLFTHRCVLNFNKIIDKTFPQIVLSSAWRWQILNGTMTLDGFGFLLRTHGVRGYLVGHTPRIGYLHRGDEIAEYIKKHPDVNENGFVILDDDTDVLKTFTMDKVVITDHLKGLTSEDADRAIQLLAAQNKNFKETLPF